MSEKEKERKGVMDYPASGEKDALKEIDITPIFERAEHARHEEHAFELLDKLVRERIQPLENDGFLNYDEFYDDFVLMIEWWDYDPDGTYSWQGTLEYFLRYTAKDGRPLTDDELAAEVEEVRKDLLRREKEREEWGKELEKRLEADEQ